jgi:RNA polymerase sigma factor (sigma-70 family)
MIDRREDELELLDTVRRVLAELSEPDRNVISLRLLEGLDYDEIAAELQCTAPAARVRASRALAKLRSGFDADLEANQHRPSESDELGEAAR